MRSRITLKPSTPYNPFMPWALIIPFFVGLSTVVQGGLNRRLARLWGLPAAALLNSSVLLAACLGLYWIARTRGETLPEFLRLRSSAEGGVGAWIVIPGLCGLLIVTAIPWSIQQVGAATTFLWIIVAQLVGSLAWDALMEGAGLAWPRILGALLAAAGVWVSQRSFG